MKTRRLPKLLAGLFLGAVTTAFGADLTIQNTRTPGFSDPTPVAPVNLNFGDTRGDQALIVFQAAGGMWGAVLRSPIPIVIDSEFNSVTTDNTFGCSADGTVLAYTQPKGYNVDSSYPNPNAGYNIPLANYLSNADLEAGGSQFTVNINGDLGTPKCDFPAAWYFGLDTQIPETATLESISMLTTLQHEFGHGLGFSSLVDPNTGKANLFDIFDYHIYDVAQDKSWTEDTASGRAALVLTPDGLSFSGPAVANDIPTYLGYEPDLYSTYNAGAPTKYSFAIAEFSGPIADANDAGIAGPLVAAVPLDACSGLTNDVNGKFALIQRSFADAGTVCSFLSKTQRAQDAGAIGVIVYDFTDEELVGMSGKPPVNIPAAFVSLADGTSLQGQLATGSVVTGFGVSTQRSNANPDSTGVLLYTPSVYRGGSSVIHWNNNTYPDTLMLEYANQPDIRLNMDFTPDVMSDLGWSVVTGLGVSVVKLLDPEVPAGGQLHYLISIINRRATDIDNVSVNATFPDGTSFVSNASSPAGCAGAFPCAVGKIPSGGVVLIVSTVQAAVGATSPFLTTVSLTPSSADANDSLTASSSQTVATGGDLQVAVTGPTTITNGLPANLITTITNAGPGDAAGVVVTGVIGGSTSNAPVLAANSGDCVSAFPCAMGTIPAGATVTIHSNFNVPSGQSGSTFTAAVTSTTPDANTGNNSASYAFAQNGSSGGGCSTTGQPINLLGLLGLAAALVLRRRGRVS